MGTGVKNNLIGAAIGAVAMAGGFALFGGDGDSSATNFNDDSFTRSDNPTETRSFLSTGESDKDCADFSSQREAQDFFEENGGPDEDPHNLDRDGDGRVCEPLR